jgi:microcystin-dependent protein
LGVFNVLGLDYGKDGTEDFALEEGVVGFDVGDDGGFDEAGV